MAVRDDFTAGEVLAAADLNDTFASKLPYSYGTATPSTTDSGFLWYDSNSTPAAPKFWDGAAFQALTSGKILQIVRATDGTDRTTTSTSYVDASISVSIAPTKSDSAVLILWTARIQRTGATDDFMYQITDASNNALSGAEDIRFGVGTTTNRLHLVAVGYSTPATTSSVTYKGRFMTQAGSNLIANTSTTGQMLAIEVSA